MQAPLQLEVHNEHGYLGSSAGAFQILQPREQNSFARRNVDTIDFVYQKAESRTNELGSIQRSRHLCEDTQWCGLLDSAEGTSRREYCRHPFEGGGTPFFLVSEQLILALLSLYTSLVFGEFLDWCVSSASYSTGVGLSGKKKKGHQCFGKANENSHEKPLWTALGRKICVMDNKK